MKVLSLIMACMLLVGGTLLCVVNVHNVLALSVKSVYSLLSLKFIIYISRYIINLISSILRTSSYGGRNTSTSIFAFLTRLNHPSPQPPPSAQHPLPNNHRIKSINTSRPQITLIITSHLLRLLLPHLIYIPFIHPPHPRRNTQSRGQSLATVCNCDRPPCATASESHTRPSHSLANVRTSIHFAHNQGGQCEARGGCITYFEDGIIRSVRKVRRDRTVQLWRKRRKVCTISPPAAIQPRLDRRVERDAMSR